VSGQIFFQIGFRVVEGHLVLPQQRMNLEPRLKPQETPHLTLAQSTRPVTLHGNSFQGMA